MEQRVEREVRKIRVFSRVARWVCGLAIVFMGVAGLIAGFGILFEFPGGKVGFGPYTMEMSKFITPLLKAWGIVFCGIIFALVIRWFFHLYALFDNLAAGRIYTEANVKRIRQIGLLALYLQLLIIVLGLVSLFLLKAGVITESSVIRQTWGITGGSFLGFVGPGIILLISWIMEVGRKIQGEADEMRRDAELVV